MKVTNEKLIGYLLLFSGVILVIFAGVSVFMVFTNRSQPVDLFNFPPIGVPLDSLFGGASPEQLEAAGQSGGGRVELLSADVLNKTTNVLAHLFLMGFIASIGTRLASIGVSLLRPIVVKMNSSQKQNIRNEANK